MKTFTKQEIRDLLNKVIMDEVSFTRMVEIMNERVSERVSEIMNERVSEPQYKDGDFLHSDLKNENITIIYRKINGSHLYYHASKSNLIGLNLQKDRYWPNDVGFRLATETEKQELLDALAKEGKRWNEEKKCIEDIPKYKFKPGDKVRIKDGISSQTHHNIYPYFDDYYNKFIGKIFTVTDYVSKYFKYVGVNETICTFPEDWLELVSDDLKIGDWVIAWDVVGDEIIAKLRYIYGSDHKYLVAHMWFQNAVKWDGTKEQLEKLRGKKL